MATCSAKGLDLGREGFAAELAALLAGASKGLDFPLIALWQVAGLAAAAFLSALLCLQRQSLVGVGWPGIAALQSVGTQLDPRFQILPELAAAFVSAGLPTPQSRTDRLEGAERWMPDTIRTLAPQMRALGLRIDSLGDLETLYQRLLDEVPSQGRSAPLPSIVGTWAHKPT